MAGQHFNFEDISGKTDVDNSVNKKRKRKNQKRFLSVAAILGFCIIFVLALYFFKPKINQATHRNEKSIAVLAFENMSGDPDQDYFSDGISEEILNSLVKVEGLKVAGRTSAFSFKRKNEDIRKIGEKLDVRMVLEGSVRKFGNKVRITAQLINVSDGFHLWS